MNDAKVIYAVEPDGCTTLERIDYVEIGGARKAFDSAIKSWIEALRYEPEQLAGEPVRTRIQTSVKFRVGGSLLQPKREQRERMHNTAECVALEGGGQDDEVPVALDSPLKPAG